MYKIKPVDRDGFHVIAVISNPQRFKARYHLFKQFEKHMKHHGANLHVVEQSFGIRPNELVEEEFESKTIFGLPVEKHHKKTNYIHLRTEEELWHKENMINIGISRLPADWKYVAWIDADVTFMRDDWIEETIHQLQHYHVVQMFQTCVDTGPHGETITVHKSFCYQYLHNMHYKRDYNFWHPGYAWAATREAIDALGGLVDYAILGAGDHHMAHALIGQVHHSYPGNIHAHYKLMLHDWQERAEKYLKRDIGYVPGTIVHHWHGKKKDRKYIERWDILTKNDFDPVIDIKKDWQGLYQLDTNKVKLRDGIRAYFRQRNEDSIDLE